MGKGSKQRPMMIDSEEFYSNWDNVFKRSFQNEEKMRHKKKLRKKVKHQYKDEH
jgi:hypothetical protein